MSDLRIRLFGDTSIYTNGHTVPPTSSKSLELLCYLLVHRERVHTREALSEVLWPGGRPAATKGYLRQALWRLGAVVGCGADPGAASAGSLLLADGPRMRINPDARYWLDVDELERTHAAVRDVPGHLLSDAQADALEAALALYRGELMATSPSDWCGPERDRLQLVYLTMLEQLMHHCEAHRRFAKGLSLGLTVLRVDPAREPTHRQLMRLHHGAGDRPSAIRQYQRCVAVLADEFGVRPSADTLVLYEQIRADAPTVRAAGGDVADPIADVRARLDQIQAALAALHAHLPDTGAAHRAEEAG